MMQNRQFSLVSVTATKCNKIEQEESPMHMRPWSTGPIKIISQQTGSDTAANAISVHCPHQNRNEVGINLDLDWIGLDWVELSWVDRNLGHRWDLVRDKI